MRSGLRLVMVMVFAAVGTACDGVEISDEAVLAPELVAAQSSIDIPVHFDGVYCSAKLSCTDSAGAPIELLKDADGVRRETVVVGFACASRDDGRRRYLHMTDVTLECADGDWAIGPPLGLGPAGPLAPILFERASYAGVEQIGYDKAFWHLAFGVNLDAMDGCVLRARAVYAEPSTPPWRFAATERTTIAWEAPLTVPGGGALACSDHFVDDGSGVVRTVEDDGVTRFCHRFRTGLDPEAPEAFETDPGCAP